MKTISRKSIILTIVSGLILSLTIMAQPYPFLLSPNGSSDKFFTYVPKNMLINGTNYITAYLSLSSYRNNSTQQYFQTNIPVQKLQLQGGNILLCRTQSAPNGPDINPSSKNGAVLFGDVINETSGFIHGKWGIEYDDQYSAGGLNFFKPKSSLTASRINFSLFLRNDGNVGIGTAEPLAKLQVADGDIFIQDINKGIIMKSPDGSCWRGTMNNTGQLEFVKLADCENLVTKTNEGSAIKTRQASLYPNPGTNYITVQSEPQLNGAEISMYDAKGSLFIQTRLTSIVQQVDASPLPDGVYSWQILLKGRCVEQGKWIKQ
jgi:hypothetical protein